MAKKDYKHVKNDDQYEALRDEGMSKERAAKIANHQKYQSLVGSIHTVRRKVNSYNILDTY